MKVHYELEDENTHSELDIIYQRLVTISKNRTTGKFFLNEVVRDFTGEDFKDEIITKPL